MSKYLLLLPFLSACASTCAPRSPPKQHSAGAPNVVLIVADDLGYADVSTYGGRVHTENIDRIGREGVVFNQGYVTAPVCGPSRAALITGRQQQRFGFEFNPRRTGSGIPAGERTMAELLGAAAYATGVIGKWHLGQESIYTPTHRGFDTFYGFLGGNSYYMHPNQRGAVSLDTQTVRSERYPGDLHTDQVIWGTENSPSGHRPGGMKILRGPEGKQIWETRYLTDAIAEESAQFIRQHSDEPFFLYTAFSAPHAPFQATQKDYDRFPEVHNELQRIYFAMIASLDDAVGRVLDALDNAGVADNTMVVFISDNGCAAYFEGLCACEPLSGGKLTYYEGGVRVPFVVRWPNVIPAGTQIDTPVSTLDILPTVLSAAGLPTPANLDGVDLRGVISGASAARSFVWRDGPSAAVRRGDWKLIKPNRSRPGGYLYNLQTDVSEQRDLAATHPSELSSLEQVYRTWTAHTRPPAWTGRAPQRYSACRAPAIDFVE